MIPGASTGHRGMGAACQEVGVSVGVCVWGGRQWVSWMLKSVPFWIKLQQFPYWVHFSNGRWGKNKTAHGVVRIVLWAGVGEIYTFLPVPGDVRPLGGSIHCPWISQRLKGCFKGTLNLPALGTLFTWPCGHLTTEIGMGKRVRDNPLLSIPHWSALNILRLKEVTLWKTRWPRAGRVATACLWFGDQHSVLGVVKPLCCLDFLPMAHFTLRMEK